jgi:predicted HTH transcriptional regulator
MGIENRLELPAPATANERATLDFKRAPTTSRVENAKDVAAFANACGGTIIVGAVAKGELLLRYEPLSLSEASAAQRALKRRYGIGAAQSLDSPSA